MLSIKNVDWKLKIIIIYYTNGLMDNGLLWLNIKYFNIASDILDTFGLIWKQIYSI